MADNWSINRYDGLDIQYRTNANTTESVWCFASLWDWSEKDGYVHVSPYKSGQNVRTTDFEDLHWTQAEPPPVYNATALAYSKLKPVEVIDDSRRK